MFWVIWKPSSCDQIWTPLFGHYCDARIFIPRFLAALGAINFSGAFLTVHDDHLAFTTGEFGKCACPRSCRLM